MTQISDEKLKAMEAEMDRFEQEILAPDSADLPRMIIGSRTYHKVSAQLKMLRATAAEGGDEEEHWEGHQGGTSDMADDYDNRYAESQEEYDDGQDMTGETNAPYLPPPPPPPPAIGGSAPSQGSVSGGPAFLPPQLKHRPPPPPPPSNRPAMQPPTRMRPPPPPPQSQFPNMMPGQQGPPPMGMRPGPPHGGPPGLMPGPRGPPPGPGPFAGGPMPMGGFPPRPMGPVGPMPPVGMMYGVSSGEAHAAADQQRKPPESQGTIEKPKVIYSAPPVTTVTKVKKKKKEKKQKEATTASNSESSTTDQTPQVAKETAPVAVEPNEDLTVADMEIEASNAVSQPKKEKKEKKKKFVRYAAGQAWEDQTLVEWDQDDFRLFCGDLGNEVTDEVLARAFVKYPTFVKAKVIRDKRTQKTKGYGFVSFKDPNDYVRAIREMNGKYVGNRPIKLRKSTWRDRNIDVVKKKEKEKKRLGLR